jgi:hypothetical protein
VFSFVEPAASFGGSRRAVVPGLVEEVTSASWTT